MGQTLLQKVWDRHSVRTLSTGQTQLFIGLHLVHEVTSPQAFDMLRLRGSTVARSCWYAFRDRVAPLVPDFHRQVLALALDAGLTPATLPSPA